MTLQEYLEHRRKTIRKNIIRQDHAGNHAVADEERTALWEILALENAVAKGRVDYEGELK